MNKKYAQNKNCVGCHADCMIFINLKQADLTQMKC